MFNFFTKKNKGFTLIETIFYLAIFFILSLATINAIIVMSKALKQANINNELTEASFVLDKITKVAGLVSGGSFSNNELILTKETSGNYKFVYSDKDIVLYENEVLVGKVNPSHLNIESFNAEIVITPKGNALKINLSISHKSSPLRIENFYVTSMLRGVY